MGSTSGVGCRWIHFGIEHGTQVTRARLGKHFSNELAVSVVSYAKSHGIRVRTSWLVDPPGHSRQSLEDTFELASTLGSHEIKLHFLVSRPGSIIYRNQQRQGRDLIPITSLNFGELSIHQRGSTECKHGLAKDEQVWSVIETFRLRMQERGYEWVDDVAFWRKFDSREAGRDDRFLSTVITRYGLGWT